MRNGFDPRRRNRNIGTAKQGHGADNALCIPSPWPWDRAFYERLGAVVTVPRKVWGADVMFLVEVPRADSFHPCTVEDVVAVLELLPTAHTRALSNIVLRQPKRKEEALRPSWGRFVYAANLGRYEGTTLLLEAQPKRKSLRWPVSLDPCDQLEIERLRQDGHAVTRTSRHFEIETTPEAIRATQLYRTVPHEIGHLVDYLGSKMDSRARSSAGKEHFAHAYADSFRREKIASGALPFDRKGTAGSIDRAGLKENWFEANG